MTQQGRRGARCVAAGAALCRLLLCNRGGGGCACGTALLPRKPARPERALLLPRTLAASQCRRQTWTIPRLLSEPVLYKLGLWQLCRRCGSGSCSQGIAARHPALSAAGAAAGGMAVVAGALSCNDPGILSRYQIDDPRGVRRRAQHVVHVALGLQYCVWPVWLGSRGCVHHRCAPGGARGAIAYHWLCFCM